MIVLRNQTLNCGWLLGPLAVCFSTILLVAHATGRPFSPAGATVFIAGIVGVYALDYWADQAEEHRPGWAIFLAVFAALAAAAGTLTLPMAKIFTAAALCMIGVAYRQWKKIPLLKTLLVAGAWTVAGLSFSVPWSADNPKVWPLAGALFALFAANALLCDLKDVSVDAQNGVCTVPVLWGCPMAARVAAMLAGIGALTAASAGRPGLVATGLALAILAACPQIVSRPRLGPALVNGVLALPALFILTGLS